MFWGRRFRSGGGGGGGGSSKVVIIVISLVISSIIAMVLVGLFAWPGWLKPKDDDNKKKKKPGDLDIDSVDPGVLASGDVPDDDLSELHRDVLKNHLSLGTDSKRIQDYNISYDAMCENVTISDKSFTFNTICSAQAEESVRAYNEDDDNGVSTTQQRDLNNCWSNCMRQYRGLCKNREDCIYDAWAFALANVSQIKTGKLSELSKNYFSKIKNVKHTDTQWFIKEIYNTVFPTLDRAVEGYNIGPVYWGPRELTKGSTTSTPVLQFFDSDIGNAISGGEYTWTPHKININPIQILIDIWDGRAPSSVKLWAMRNINLMKTETTTLNERRGPNVIVANGGLYHMAGGVSNRVYGSGESRGSGWIINPMRSEPTSSNGGGSERTENYSHWTFVNCPKSNTVGILDAQQWANDEIGTDVGERWTYNDWGRVLEYVPGRNFGLKLRGNITAHNRGLGGYSGDVKAFSFVTGKHTEWTMTINGEPRLLGAIKPYKADGEIMLVGGTRSSGDLNTMEIIKAFSKKGTFDLSLLWYFENAIA